MFYYAGFGVSIELLLIKIYKEYCGIKIASMMFQFYNIISIFLVIYDFNSWKNKVKCLLNNIYSKENCQYYFILVPYCFG